MPSPQTNARPADATRDAPLERSPLDRAALDALNLEQALRDFEIANRRVVDLTQRLLDAGDEIRALRTELELLRIDHARLQATNHDTHMALAGIQASRGYTVVRIGRAARRMLSR